MSAVMEFIILILTQRRAYCKEVGKIGDISDRKLLRYVSCRYCGGFPAVVCLFFLLFFEKMLAFCNNSIILSVKHLFYFGIG